MKKAILDVNFSINGFNSARDAQKRGLVNWKTGTERKNRNTEKSMIRVYFKKITI